jgi:hypothetical protein
MVLLSIQLVYLFYGDYYYYLYHTTVCRVLLR